jgi:hypothetical protein
MSLVRSAVWLSFGALVAAGCASPPPEPQTPAASSEAFLGRWDLTVETAEGSYPSWLELTGEGDALAGRFVGRSGHARPIPAISVEGTTLSFSLPKQYEEMDEDLSFVGKLASGGLSGTTNANAPAGSELSWTAVRAPELPSPESVEWGEPIELVDGESLAGWHLMDPEQDGFWKVVDGILVNDVVDEGDVGEGTGLISDREFEDFKLHAEFMYPKGSNSGLYLRGRYEVQVIDGYGKQPGSRNIAGVYGFITPTSNPAKPAGEWQTMDITLIGRRVTVALNGETVIDDREIPGITGGALNSNEGEPGPLFIQGDHGPISFRSIVVTPALEGAAAEARP